MHSFTVVDPDIFVGGGTTMWRIR